MWIEHLLVLAHGGLAALALGTALRAAHKVRRTLRRTLRAQLWACGHLGCKSDSLQMNLNGKKQDREQLPLVMAALAAQGQKQIGELSRLQRARDSNL